MKKKLILMTALVMTLSLSIIGCSPDEVVSKVTGGTSGSKDLISLSAEEFYSMDPSEISKILYDNFQDKLPEIKKIYEASGATLEEVANADSTSPYSGVIGIGMENYKNREVGSYRMVGSKIEFEPSEGNITFAVHRMDQIVSDKEMKNVDYKFEETDFYKVCELVSSAKIDVKDINKKVNAYYDGDESMGEIDIIEGNENLIISLGYDVINYEYRIAAFPFEPEFAE